MIIGKSLEDYAELSVKIYDKAENILLSFIGGIVLPLAHVPYLATDIAANIIPKKYIKDFTGLSDMFPCITKKALEEKNIAYFLGLGSTLTGIDYELSSLIQ